jgi:DNA-binding NarL/FixJ family response regulator
MDPVVTMTEALRRDRFRVALVGKPAVEHAEMIRRAGYVVVAAEDGVAAGRLFRQDAEPYDALVIDFALEGRPPEAVLLFGRRTSPSAPVVALVPADEDEAFRRAFLAGARDVLPSPARGEDILDAVDIVLEPRALEMLVDELRTQLPAGARGADYAPEHEDALLEELEELRGKVRQVEARERRVTDQFRVQALEAVTAKDDLEDMVEDQNRRIVTQERNLKEMEARARLHERAAEELQLKLKEARDQRRKAEERASRAETRVHELEIIQEAFQPVGDTFTGPGDTNPTDVWSLAEEADPEAALLARREDEVKLDELERVLAEKARLDARVEDLEETVSRPGQRKGEDGKTDVTPPPVSMAGPEQAELDRTRRQRDALEARVLELEVALSDAEGESEAIQHLKRTLAERDDRIVALQRQRDVAEDMLTKLAGLEEELSLAQKSARNAARSLHDARHERDQAGRRVKALELEIADAQVHLEEMGDVANERDQLSSKLRAEREAHLSARNRLRALERSSREDRADRATHNDDLDAARRGLVLARARAESLQAEIERLKVELNAERAELVRLRGTVASRSAAESSS